MKYRTLGKTGISVSEIGLGCWQLGNSTGWNGPDVETSERIIDTAIDNGCNFFDTAPNYADGKSEEIIGNRTKHRRDKVIICSKFGHTPNQGKNFDHKLIRQGLENSLRKLQTDYLDILLLHNPPIELMRDNDLQYNVLRDLQKEGKIRHYGISVDWSEEILEAVNNTDVQVLEVMFNIFHQEPLKAFEAIRKSNTGIIVKIPLDSGWLSGKYTSNSIFTDTRNRWTPEQISRRAELLAKVEQLKDTDISMVHEALGYVLSYNEVGTIIPGASSIQQLTQNLIAGDFTVSMEKRQAYEEFYSIALKSNPLGW
jgi:aryl-alcohol dehydrogenase-like predicted oxidoreductase